MADAAALPAPRRLALAAGLTLALALLSGWIGRAPIGAPLLLGAAVLLFTATLASAEAGLILLIASMLLSPEIDLGGLGGSGLDGRRSLILRTDDLVLVLVGLGWMARLSIHKDLGAIRRTPHNAWIGLYTACGAISTLLGIAGGRVRPAIGLLFLLKYVEYFIIFFITVNHVRREDQLRRLLAAVLLTCGVITLWAWVQIPAGVRPTAPFEGARGEPNTLGGYLVLMMSVAIALALTLPEPRWRRGCAALALAALPPLLATLSRSSWIALLASISALLALSPARRTLAAVTVVILVLLIVARPERVADRVRHTFGGGPQSVRAGPVALDPSAAARLDSWSDALRGFGRRPLFGWGVTGYGFLDAQYFRILVELGLAGLAAFAMLCGSLGAAALRAFRHGRGPLRRGLGLGLAAALAGLLVHAIGTNTFILIRIMEPFWLLAGLMAAAERLEEPA